MVSCECGGKLKISEVNGKMMHIWCPECDRTYKRKWFDLHLFEINRENISIHPLLGDLWRVFKRNGVNFKAEVSKDSDWWCQWWTPTWHFGKGPYVTIGFWKLRIYRGY